LLLSHHAELRPRRRKRRRAGSATPALQK